MAKTFYDEKGVVLNDAGFQAKNQMETNIRRIYEYWLDQGYSASELREMFFTQVFTTTTFVNAMRA